MDSSSGNKIKNLIPEERPREKLMEKGAQALTDVELLAIIINTGTTKKSALDLARNLWMRYDQSWTKLGELSVQELMKHEGIGAAKAVSISATLEIARRKKVEETKSALKRRSITDKHLLFAEFEEYFLDRNKERFVVMYLNNANKKIKCELISEGSQTATVVDIKEIVKKALECNALKVAVAHNHPSGNLQPSKEDINLTNKLKQALEYLDIKLLDHLIIAGSDYISLNEQGFI
ncbi:MAG: DNA repair protein RadC [Vicingaceae bacterium]|nr:MAG: DNA repair protein RadC [Vicingaceae bacterium]